MKLLIGGLLGCVAVLASIMLLCQNIHPSRDTDWAIEQLRITHPGLVVEDLPEIALKMPRAIDMPGTPPVSRSVSHFDPIVAITQPFKAIKDAPILNVDRAADQVADSDLVLGVVISDQARAYPISMLCGPKREIINDLLGDVRIAATW